MGSGGFAPFKVKNRISATNAFAIALGAHTLSTGVSNFNQMRVLGRDPGEKGTRSVCKAGKREREAGDCVIVFQFKKKRDGQRAGSQQNRNKKQKHAGTGIEGFGERKLTPLLPLLRCFIKVN